MGNLLKISLILANNKAEYKEHQDITVLQGIWGWSVGLVPEMSYYYPAIVLYESPQINYLI